MNFFKCTSCAKKILILDLGFLGDTIHLIPALWAIRRSYPKSSIHVAASSNVISLFKCFPWIDEVFGYTRYPKHASLKESILFVLNLRRQKYDAIINLNGSDRSAWLGFLSGAQFRLGRLTSRGIRRTSRILFTHFIHCPYDIEPVYIQRLRCLEKQGFPFTSFPKFNCVIQSNFLYGTDINIANADQYFHISPFTTADKKELELNQLVKLINQLNDQFPTKKIVLSCAKNDREKNKMHKLLSKLSFKPWRVYSGSLDLSQLAAVIKYSSLHISGDTGTMHLALMTKTPTISWFQPTSSKDWIPQGSIHKIFWGNKNIKSNVKGISLKKVFQAIKLLLK